MSLPSLKKDMIRSYMHLPNMEGLESNQVTIITAFGIINGVPSRNDVEDFSEETAVASLVLVKLNSFIVDEYKKSNSINDGQLLEGNDGFICLNDVKLTTSSGTIFQFTILNVFFDQIIGITISS